MDQNIEIAAKSLKQEKMSVKSFLNEAEILKTLKHPNIVKLLATVTTEEPYYIILEYLAKRDLKHFLQSDKGKDLKLMNLLEIDLQITQGMMYLHMMRVLHRDLRAENILIGENLDVKISDFGLACVLNSHDNSYTETECSQFPVRWTAPEAFQERKFTFQSDVWSFGVLMFEVISLGQEPYSGLNNDMALQMTKHGMFRKKPTNGPTDVPDSYFNKMIECWNLQPEKRPHFSHLYTFFVILLQT